MSVEGMVNTCPYLHRGGGFLQVGAFNRGFLEETASELSLKAVSTSLPWRLEFRRHLGWNLGIGLLEKFLGL